jgi:hypothetical protein
MSIILHKGHFLGAKLRALRKRNGLTLEEVSARCIQRDAELAPSVSYLSMIEAAARLRPAAESARLRFQRDTSWFLDRTPTWAPSAPRVRAAARSACRSSQRSCSRKMCCRRPSRAALADRHHWPAFAHLLIRSHQEMSRNDFPDLERAAESVGERRFPLSVEDLLKLCRRHGLTLRWFDRKPILARDNDREVRSVLRSFFESPRTVYLNRALKADPARLRFDLASHLAHRVLHGGDGLKSEHATGGEMGGSPRAA